MRTSPSTIAANADFRRRCDRDRVAPDDLRGADDLRRVPLIPVRTFKTGRQARCLLSVPLDAIDLEIQSTGTGASRAWPAATRPRPPAPASPLLALYREFFGIAHGAGLFLCPSPAETPEMGMVKVFNLFTGLLDDRAYLVRDFASTRGGRRLPAGVGRPADPAPLRPALHDRPAAPLPGGGGPPAAARPGSFAITLGGWKRFNRERIRRPAFDRQARRSLGIRARPTSATCTAWSSRTRWPSSASTTASTSPRGATSRSATWTTSPRKSPPGRAGVVGLLDALSLSYPGFLLSEDVGRVGPRTSAPAAGTGQTISFVGRLPRAEPGCCAVTIERFMARKEAGRG